METTENNQEQTNGSSSQPTEAFLNPVVQSLNKIFGVQFTVATSIDRNYLEERTDEAFFGANEIGAARKLDNGTLIMGNLEIPATSFDPDHSSAIGEILSALRDGNLVSLKNLPVAAVANTVMTLSQWNANLTISGQGYTHQIQAIAFPSIQSRQNGLEAEQLSINPMYALNWRVISNKLTDSDKEWLNNLTV